MKDYSQLREERLSRISSAQRALFENSPPLDVLGVDGLRAGLAERLSQVPLAPGVEFRDVVVDGPNGPVPTRIFTPPGGAVDSPVVVHIHAGGFVAGGGLDTWTGYNSILATVSDAVVVAPDFRLPPEHRFPTGLGDNWAVLNWVAAGGDDAEWDASRIAIGGGCTGGNMAAVLSLMARDAGAPELSLQFLESWPADLRNDTRSQEENAEGYGLRQSDNAFVTSQYLAEPEDRWDWRASPLLAESVRGVAPALITVGDWDVLRDEDIQYANRLRDAGVPVELQIDENVGHIGGDRQMQMKRLGEALRKAFGTSSADHE
ncbi:MAG: alpha/beta hydrolase [Leucobacter sp.]